VQLPRPRWMEMAKLRCRKEQLDRTQTSAPVPRRACHASPGVRRSNRHHGVASRHVGPPVRNRFSTLQEQ
jgi:hypothetical protein